MQSDSALKCTRCGRTIQQGQVDPGAKPGPVCMICTGYYERAAAIPKSGWPVEQGQGRLFE